MNVLVIGKGGREHALVWKLAQSPRIERVYCAPGNAGTAEDGVNVPIEANDFDRLIRFAQKENVGLTVVGPEDPLAGGIVDAFQAAGLRVFGPGNAGGHSWIHESRMASPIRSLPSKSDTITGGAISGGPILPVHDWSRVDAGLFHDFHQVPRMHDAGHQPGQIRLPPPFSHRVEWRHPREGEKLMSLTEVTVGGTLTPDGTLELDQRPNLSPGRVTVVLRQGSEPAHPPAEDWWQFMQKARKSMEEAGCNFMDENEMQAHIEWLREGDRIDDLLREVDEHRRKPGPP